MTAIKPTQRPTDGGPEPQEPRGLPRQLRGVKGFRRRSRTNDAADDAGPLVVFYELPGARARVLAVEIARIQRSYQGVSFAVTSSTASRRLHAGSKALFGECALVVYQPIGASTVATTETAAWALLRQNERVGFARRQCRFPLYMTRGEVCARAPRWSGRPRRRRARDIGGGRARRLKVAWRGAPTATTRCANRGRRTRWRILRRRRRWSAPVIAKGGLPRRRSSSRRTTRRRRCSWCADRVLRVLGFMRRWRRRRRVEWAGIPGRVFPPCVFDRPPASSARARPCRVLPGILRRVVVYVLATTVIYCTHRRVCCSCRTRRPG